MQVGLTTPAADMLVTSVHLAAVVGELGTVVERGEDICEGGEHIEASNNSRVVNGDGLLWEVWPVSSHCYTRLQPWGVSVMYGEGGGYNQAAWLRPDFAAGLLVDTVFARAFHSHICQIHFSRPTLARDSDAHVASRRHPVARP